jgi:hypothetical protein
MRLGIFRKDQSVIDLGGTARQIGNDAEPILRAHAGPVNIAIATSDVRGAQQLAEIMGDLMQELKDEPAVYEKFREVDVYSIAKYPKKDIQ